MSSVCGKLDFKDPDFEISTSSPTQCSNGSKHSLHAGSEESQESDGDETGYINQTANEESATKNQLESATKDFGKSTLGSLPPKSSDDEDKDENLPTLDMSSVYGKLDFKDADFEISTSSPTQCSNGSRHSSHTGSEESQESDGDETGYINQSANEESASKDFCKFTLCSLPPKSSDDEDKDENLTTTPVVLIPAIKGSREKHGLSLRKSVSWADDVFDPPSIASHTRNKKQQQKSKSKDSHRKTGEKGQKGKDNSFS